MLRNSIAGAGGAKKPVYQSLLYVYNNVAYQIKIESGVLINSLTTPNSSTSNGFTLYDAQINPLGAHYATSAYGASASANYPYAHGSFNYSTGFGAPTTIYLQYGRSTSLQWHPQGNAIMTRGDIYSHIIKFNTGTASGSSSTSYLYSSTTNSAGLNRTGTIIALQEPYASPYNRTVNWSTSGLGTQYSTATTTTSPFYYPFWLSDSSFVFMGIYAYSYTENVGFTGTNFSTTAQLGITPTLVGTYSDSVILGYIGTTVYAIGFSKTTGFSLISSYTESEGIGSIQIDSANGKIYYMTGLVSSVYKLKTLNWTGGSFTSPTTLSTKTTPATLTQIFTHTL
jgi:hypothetical protein